MPLSLPSYRGPRQRVDLAGRLSKPPPGVGILTEQGSQRMRPPRKAAGKAPNRVSEGSPCVVSEEKGTGFKPCPTAALRGDRRRPRSGLRGGILDRLTGCAARRQPDDGRQPPRPAQLHTTEVRSGRVGHAPDRHLCHGPALRLESYRHRSPRRRACRGARRGYRAVCTRTADRSTSLATGDFGGPHAATSWSRLMFSTTTTVPSRKVGPPTGLARRCFNFLGHVNRLVG
jgi:hypothetical protein